LRDAGLERDEMLLFGTYVDASLLVESLLVFYRRFMLGLMRSPTATSIGIVLTAIEEAASRSTMVQRDLFFRRRSGLPDYTPEELELQRMVWSIQIGNSTVIEVSAILIHTACVVFFLPHRYIFNLGYGDSEETGVVAMALLLGLAMELTGEVLTDAMSGYVEMEEGVPLDKFLAFMRKPSQLVAVFGMMVHVSGVMLWAFSRVPTAALCDDTDPCSCLLARGGSNFAIYEEACAACVPVDVANATTERADCANRTDAARTRFATNPADVIDSDALSRIAFGLSAFVAAAALVYLMATISKRRRALQKVQSEVKVKSRHLELQKKELRKTHEEKKALQQSLANAQAMVAEAMASEEAMLKPFSILYKDLELDATLGEGSFGTVMRGMLRGEIPVAVKTLRVTKLSSSVLDKFKQELKVRFAA
jgi:hypothetical protein